jgi:hypothetical protein
MTIPNVLVGPLAQLAFAGLAALVTYLTSLIRKRVHSKLAGDALTALTSLAGTCVAAAMQARVKDLKDENKPGKWTAEAGLAIRGEVLSQLKALGGPMWRQLVTLKRLDSRSVDELLLALIESSVAQQHALGEMKS